ncbi:MAG: FAD-dependent oxidoreductase [Limnochordia bacterium]|jgi:hypothetical protein
MVISKPRVVVVGGGWAGCAAALAAREAGLEVTLIERSYMLLGSGLVGGIFKNNGRLTALEELRYMGARSVIQIMEDTARHNNLAFPGHRHASLYDAGAVEPAMVRLLGDQKITVLMESRVTDAFVARGRIVSVSLADGGSVEGEVFVDATGTAGPPGHCLRYGYGCVMCLYRCSTFGPRVSLAALAGVKEKLEPSAIGVSGSCEISQNSLASWLRDKLAVHGFVALPVPKYLIHGEFLDRKACQQYALPDYVDNLIMLDNGHAKLMTPFFPLAQLRQLPGLARAAYHDPYGGGRGNSVRFGLLTPREETLQVQGVENLFCAGEKAGLMVGHTEGIVTGSLAGHNSARWALDLPLLTLPTTTACGDFIHWVGEQIAQGRIATRYTFSGGPYFQRMQETKLYTTHLGLIEDRVRRAQLVDVFAKPLLAGEG